MYALANTFNNPTQGGNAQRGFPAPGSGAQFNPNGAPPIGFGNIGAEPEGDTRPTKGTRSWFRPAAPAGGQRGSPTPEAAGQERSPGSMPNVPQIFGGVIQKFTRQFSRGAAAYVPNFGKVLTNPIGAGVVALHRPQASYGPAGQYENGAIWWTSQAVPTSIGMQGLTDPQTLAALLGQTNVQAVVRTTG